MPGTLSPGRVTSFNSHAQPSNHNVHVDYMPGNSCRSTVIRRYVQRSAAVVRYTGVELLLNSGPDQATQLLSARRPVGAILISKSACCVSFAFSSM